MFFGPKRATTAPPGRSNATAPHGAEAAYAVRVEPRGSCSPSVQRCTLAARTCAMSGLVWAPQPARTRTNRASERFLIWIERAKPSAGLGRTLEAHDRCASRPRRLLRSGRGAGGSGAAPGALVVG